jgi:hypothetical protein
MTYGERSVRTGAAQETVAVLGAGGNDGLRDGAEHRPGGDRAAGLEPIRGQRTGDMMPKTGRSGQPRAGELPGTLRRSSKEAQETFTKARDSAVQTYGEGDEANRAAYSALKHRFEKRGDHWIAKPADPED